MLTVHRRHREVSNLQNTRGEMADSDKLKF